MVGMQSIGLSVAGQASNLTKAERGEDEGF